MPSRCRSCRTTRSSSPARTGSPWRRRSMSPCGRWRCLAKARRRRDRVRSSAATTARIRPPRRRVCLCQNGTAGLAKIASFVWLVTKHRGGNKQAIAAVLSGKLITEQRHKNRPLVVEADHDDVARIAGLVSHLGPVELTAPVKRRSCRCRGEGRILLHVDVEIVLAIEQRDDPRADRVLERGLVVGGR